MKIAYLITAHAYPGQLLRLVTALDSAHSLFFIHIDKKSDIEPFRKIEQVIDKRKIIWLERKPIVWAGFNAIKTTLDGLRAAANHPERPQYICFISGQHYPIKPVGQFHSFLKNSNGNSFLSYSQMPRPGWQVGGMDRILYHHIVFKNFRIAWPLISYLKLKFEIVDPKRYRLARKLIRFFPSARRLPRKFLKDSIPFEGSNWFTLHVDLAKDILKSVQSDKSVYNYYKHTHCADEMFFQTLILNKLPEWKERIVNSNLTFIKWDPTTGRPYTLNESNLEEIKSSDAFLARKFTLTESHRLLEQLDAFMDENRPDPIKQNA